MANFIKTILPKEGYEEIKKIGNNYVVHLRGTEVDDMVECYECMTLKEPDLEVLNQELELYLQQTVKRAIARAKANKIAELEAYDASEEVNSFSVNGKTMWLDAATRQQLRISLDAMQQAGRDNVTKWFDGEQYTYPIDVWYYMLAQVEVYAADALNVTESHKAAINALTSVSDVEDYDYTTGYPEKLEF